MSKWIETRPGASWISCSKKPIANRTRVFCASGRPASEISGQPPLWNLFSALPDEIQKLAVKNYRLWRRSPNHPSLRFRRLQGRPDRFSVRVGDHYRAVGRLTEDTIVWIWIGTHAEYDRLVSRD